MIDLIPGLYLFQEEQPKPIKKLRLIQRPAEPEVQLNLQGLNSHEALQTLLKFENSLPVGCNVLCNVVRELVEHYGREKEAVVRGTIANILGKLSKIPGISAENLVDELIPLLKAEGRYFACKCRLLITFAKNLDPDRARQNVGPDLDPNCLTL